MRLARLASVTRNLTDKSQEDLARRLQLGLPDSTYTRVQEYLARQEQIPRQAARSTISNSTAMTASRYKFKDAPHHPPSDPSDSKATNGLKRRSRDLDFDEPTEPAKRCALEERLEGRSDFGRRLSAQADKNYLSVKAEADGLSPQSIAVAALMAQRGSSRPTTESSRAPLTPTRAEGTSSNNREQVDKHSPAKDSAGKESVLNTGVTGWQSMPEVTELCAFRFKSSDKSPMDTASSDRSTLSAAKPFPFRQEDCLIAKPHPRIIDRRRARNEDMRRQYMQKRLEQQRAREAKLRPRSQSRQSEPSKSAPMLDGHDAPRLATSDQASNSPSSVCNAPPSMRNLLNALPKSS